MSFSGLQFRCIVAFASLAVIPTIRAQSASESYDAYQTAQHANALAQVPVQVRNLNAIGQNAGPDPSTWTAEQRRAYANAYGQLGGNVLAEVPLPFPEPGVGLFTDVVQQGAQHIYNHFAQMERYERMIDADTNLVPPTAPKPLQTPQANPPQTVESSSVSIERSAVTADHVPESLSSPIESRSDDSLFDRVSRAYDRSELAPNPNQISPPDGVELDGSRWQEHVSPGENLIGWNRTLINAPNHPDEAIVHMDVPLLGPDGYPLRPDQLDANGQPTGIWDPDSKSWVTAVEMKRRADSSLGDQMQETAQRSGGSGQGGADTAKPLPGSDRDTQTDSALSSADDEVALAQVQANAAEAAAMVSSNLSAFASSTDARLRALGEKIQSLISQNSATAAEEIRKLTEANRAIISEAEAKRLDLMADAMQQFAQASSDLASELARRRQSGGTLPTSAAGGASDCSADCASMKRTLESLGRAKADRGGSFGTAETNEQGARAERMIQDYLHRCCR